MDPVIVCHDLTKALRRRVVIEDLSFAVNRGRVCGFLGPNGAGKTTTIRILLGLLRADKGGARVLGHGTPVPPETACRIGFMLEQPSFYPWLSGVNNLKALLYANRGDLTDRDLDASIERCGLAADRGRKVAEYSQGMRQRLALAAATTGSPEALILDEPTNGLDPHGMVAFRQIIREEADRGCAVLLSSHQLTEVEKSCDDVVVIDRGRVVSSGSMDAFAGLHGQIEVRVSVEDHARAAAALKDFHVQAPEDGRFIVLGDLGREVGEALHAAGVIPETVMFKTATLEDMFLDLTTGDR